MTVDDLIDLLIDYPKSAEVYIGQLPNDEQCLKVWDDELFPDGEVVCELDTGQ